MDERCKTKLRRRYKMGSDLSTGQANTEPDAERVAIDDDSGDDLSLLKEISIL